jgi:hypothetical protein
MHAGVCVRVFKDKKMTAKGSKSGIPQTCMCLKYHLSIGLRHLPSQCVSFRSICLYNYLYMRMCVYTIIYNHNTDNYLSQTEIEEKLSLSLSHIDLSFLNR